MSARPDDIVVEISSLPSGSIEDKELTLAFQRGDKGAYQAIHDRYSARVQGVCRRMLTHPEDAQEAAQEAFLKTYQALGRFNGRYHLGAWITRIATNVCLDHLRAKSRKPAQDASLEVLDMENPAFLNDDGPEEVVIRRYESRRVRKVLDSLPPMHRAAIVLRDFEGLTYEETAIALGITDCQVKALIHRARQGFKRSWISSGLAALVPTRWIARLRNVEPLAKEPVATQALTTTVHAAPACTTALQQCGQYLADKVAPVLTAALVVGTTTGASLATPAAAPEDPQSTHSVGTVPEVIDFQSSARPVKKRVASTAPDNAATPVVAPVEEEPAPPPAEEPNPQPEPEPTAPPAGEEEGPDEGGTPEEPLPVQPVQVAVGFERGLAIEPVTPGFEETSASCYPLKVQQRIETIISDGDASYPVAIALNADAQDVSVFTTIWKDEYEVSYPGAAYVSNMSGPGNNIQISYRGTYGYHPDAEKAGLPHNGTLRVDLRLDCAASSVIDEALTFGVPTSEDY